jgi:hypothetical protein
MYTFGRELDHRTRDDLPHGESAGNGCPLNLQLSTALHRLDDFLAQAAVSMPILAPLGDLVGITRQTNVFIPTQGYFMAALGILKIPWEKWVRRLLPLLLI